MTTYDDGAPLKDCRSVMARLFDLLDGELTAEREREIRSHITSCPDCLTHHDFEERFLSAVRKAKDARCAPGSLRDKLMRALQAEGLAQ